MTLRARVVAQRAEIKRQQAVIDRLTLLLTAAREKERNG